MDKIKDSVRERLGEVRRIKHDFATHARIDPVWEGIVGQCSVEERYLVGLLELIEAETKGK